MYLSACRWKSIRLPDTVYWYLLIIIALPQVVVSPRLAPLASCDLGDTTSRCYGDGRCTCVSSVFSLAARIYGKIEDILCNCSSTCVRLPRQLKSGKHPSNMLVLITMGALACVPVIDRPGMECVATLMYP